MRWGGGCPSQRRATREPGTPTAAPVVKRTPMAPGGSEPQTPLGGPNAPRGGWGRIAPLHLLGRPSCTPKHRASSPPPNKQRLSGLPPPPNNPKPRAAERPPGSPQSAPIPDPESPPFHPRRSVTPGQPLTPPITPEVTPNNAPRNGGATPEGRRSIPGCLPTAPAPPAPPSPMPLSISRPRSAAIAGSGSARSDGGDGPEVSGRTRYDDAIRRAEVVAPEVTTPKALSRAEVAGRDRCAAGFRVPRATTPPSPPPN